MKAETLAEAGTQVKNGLNDFTEKVKDFSGNVAERWKDTREDLERRARQIKTATEDGIAEARHRIKNHPLTFVAAFASGAFVLGLVTGWAVTRKRR